MASSSEGHHKDITTFATAYQSICSYSETIKWHLRYASIMFHITRLSHALCMSLSAACMTRFFLSSFLSFPFHFEDLLSFALSCIERERPREDREIGIVYLIPPSWADGFKGTNRFVILMINSTEDCRECK
jgi:hypothetical protein